MTETEIVELIVTRALQYEHGGWLTQPSYEVASALWGIAHDYECACEDTTVGHLDEYRHRKITQRENGDHR